MSISSFSRALNWLEIIILPPSHDKQLSIAIMGNLSPFFDWREIIEEQVYTLVLHSTTIIDSAIWQNCLQSATSSLKVLQFLGFSAPELSTRFVILFFLFLLLFLVLFLYALHFYILLGCMLPRVIQESGGT